MAFLIHSTGDNRVPTHHRVPCGAITPEVGMAMVLTAGVLAKASGTTKPTHISMTERSAACESGEMIYTIRAENDITFETTFAADPAALKLGDKVTIHTDGAQVTATTQSGVAEIVSILEQETGGRVLVRFP